MIPALVKWRGVVVGLALSSVLLMVLVSYTCKPPDWIRIWSSKDEAGAKTILLWVPFYSQADYGFGLGHEPFLVHGCAVSNCEVTTNRSALSFSHAVVFHHRNADIKDLPKFRAHWQRWVFFLMEPPTYTYPDLRIFGGLYNWTMTYRRDSDIVAPYGLVLPRKLPAAVPERNYTDIVGRKRKLVVWIASNCNTWSKREQYVKQLAQHVSIDVYGGCGTLSCSRNGKCEPLIFEQYKFYLSFENSLCADYVTEKFYRVLLHDIVPVVFGGADYSALAAPMSYVDARKFESPRHLARFLLTLDENNNVYAQYLQWKMNYVVKYAQPFCDLCAKLNEPEITRKWYADIHEWWTESACDMREPS